MKGTMMSFNRQWTIYLAQDKHLDYNWCGTNTEIEVRMVSLLDYYLHQAEKNGRRWNLDSTIWVDVYRRHRGEEGLRRLLDAIRNGYIGYAANRSVLLWGILSTELAIRACYDALLLEQTAETNNKTVLIMENPGLLWGVATVLTEGDFAYLGRGIYNLRAESYNHKRDSSPLFWWQAPNGKRLLVRWDMYEGTDTWGGYAEGAQLMRAADEKWDAFHVRTFGDRNTPVVYQKRQEFIAKTVERYEAYGDRYPISSILLLGIGHDNWTKTDDYWLFIEQFNTDGDGRIRLVDARYEDFFEAAQQEIETKGLDIPTLKGSFGICWEEWAAHLAGLTQNFRQSDRLLRLAEADYALQVINGKAEVQTAELLRQGYQALLDFAEHDMGGCNRRLAAISAGARANAVTQALDIARSRCPVNISSSPMVLQGGVVEAGTFAWRKTQVTFDETRCAVTSLREGDWEWVAIGGPAFGEFVHTRYQSERQRETIFPRSLEASPEAKTYRFSCYRNSNGVEVQTDGERWGFRFATRWFFHSQYPWLDVTYYLADGWSDEAQTVQFCFPLALTDPVYRYDTAGAVLVAGSVAAGGDDLPGANPELFAAQTFAAAHDKSRGVILLTPDAYLVQFGPQAVRATGYSVADIPAQITSLPMMNLTRNDWQFGQGGQRQWTFRYRLIFTSSCYQPLLPICETQHFGVPPYLQVPGQKPALRGLEALDISFEGGPVTTFKVAEDGKRLILRCWNILASPSEGSLKLPPGYASANLCDALERPKRSLAIKQGRVAFTVDAHGLLTIALCQDAVEP